MREPGVLGTKGKLFQSTDLTTTLIQTEMIFSRIYTGHERKSRVSRGLWRRNRAHRSSDGGL